MTGPPGSPSRRLRRFPRYQLDVRITAQAFRDDGVVSTWGRSFELGGDGIGVTLAAELEAGEVASLEFTVPPDPHPLKVRAIVRYRQGLRHGFEFLALTQEQRDALQRALTRLAELS
jgi:PilZ domain-containing protein